MIFFGFEEEGVGGVVFKMLGCLLIIIMILKKFGSNFKVFLEEIG